MNILIRLTAIILVGTPTYFMSYVLAIAILKFDESQGLTMFSILVTMAACWFVWRITATSHDGAIPSILLGAVVVGVAGFLLGFVGPMIVMPGANQGPLIGIFVTGPIGFLAGPIIGFTIWVYKRRRLKLDQSS